MALQYVQWSRVAPMPSPSAEERVVGSLACGWPTYARGLTHGSRDAPRDYRQTDINSALVEKIDRRMLSNFRSSAILDVLPRCDVIARRAGALPFSLTALRFPQLQTVFIRSTNSDLSPECKSHRHHSLRRRRLCPNQRLCRETCTLNQQIRFKILC